MVYRVRVSWICMLCLLWVSGLASAAKPDPKPTPKPKQTSFTKALLESQVGTIPAQAYFLVGLFKATGAHDNDVEALRRELLHAYGEQLAGLSPMPAGNRPPQ